jgi:subtilisin family serine protease
MKFVVTKNLNVRVGAPSINSPCFQYISPGNIIEVDGIYYKGDLYDGIDLWLRDKAGNYYWSGGVINESEGKNIIVDPNFNLINYNNIILNIPNDWRLTNGRGINVAVFDTGINVAHKDFDGIFNQNNTKNFSSSSSGIQDIYNHGTQITGIIGARTSTNNGIRGVAPECNLFVLKVGEDDGSFLPTNIIKALEWSKSNNINIINMSFSINYRYYHDQGIESALDSIQNCVIVASAGENSILTQDFLYPAMHKEVISVGAINQSINDKFCSNLNYILPLLQIPSCSGGNKILYKTESGSSISTAFLTGIIALYLSYSKTNNLQKTAIMQELDKSVSQYYSNMELNNLLIIKP